MDLNNYDEFGNYIGPELSDEEDEDFRDVHQPQPAMDEDADARFFGEEEPVDNTGALMLVDEGIPI